MLSTRAKRRLLEQASWSGFVYVAFLMVGIWPISGFFPSQPPAWDAEQITAVYHGNVYGIRVGMVLVLVGSMFWVPWTAILAKLLARIEGGPGILTYCMLISGGANLLLTAYPAGWWLTASFRLDRDPQIVQLLNDIAWLQFLGVIAPYYFCVISIAWGALADDSENPLLPRWVGYFNLWFLLTLIPLSIIFFFKTGPFAWNGIFGFYLPFCIFWIWFFVMTYAVRKAIPRIDELDPSPAAGHRQTGEPR